jgi:hypothetical protein
VNRAEYLLTVAGEEAVEVAQRVSKALRFGLTEVQPGQSLNNAERIVEEFHQLYAMLDWLQREGAIPDRIDIAPDQVTMRQKRDKVQRFMAISVKEGALSA